MYIHNKYGLYKVKGENIISMRYFKYSKMLLFHHIHCARVKIRMKIMRFQMLVHYFSIFIVSDRKAIGSLGISISDVPRR